MITKAVLRVTTDLILGWGAFWPFRQHQADAVDNDYIFRIPARGSWIQVIGVTPGQIITEKRILRANLYDGFAVADPRTDIAKLAVIERHHKTGNVDLGFVQGLGIEKGAIVSSVAHDSHNFVVAGMSDSDMLS